MLLYISYQSSIGQHPLNTPTDFVYELTKELTFDGEWFCCLKEVICDKAFTKPVCFFCDIVQPSSVLGEWKPILRIVQPVLFLKDHYHKVITNNLKRIRFQIRKHDGSLPDLSKNNIILVLQISQLVKQSIAV